MLNRRTTSTDSYYTTGFILRRVCWVSQLRLGKQKGYSPIPVPSHLHCSHRYSPSLLFHYTINLSLYLLFFLASLRFLSLVSRFKMDLSLSTDSPWMLYVSSTFLLILYLWISFVSLVSILSAVGSVHYTLWSVSLFYLCYTLYSLSLYVATFSVSFLYSIRYTLWFFALSLSQCLSIRYTLWFFGLSLYQCLFYTLYSLVYHFYGIWLSRSFITLRCFHTVYGRFCIFAPLGYFSLRPSMIILAVSNPGWERSFPISSSASHECIGFSALDRKQPIHSPQRFSVMEIVSWS